MKLLMKVLMEGSGFNIMYAEILDTMGIKESCLTLSRAPFHGVVLGK